MNENSNGNGAYSTAISPSLLLYALFEARNPATNKVREPMQVIGKTFGINEHAAVQVIKNLKQRQLVTTTGPLKVGWKSLTLTAKSLEQIYQISKLQVNHLQPTQTSIHCLLDYENIVRSSRENNQARISLAKLNNYLRDINLVGFKLAFVPDDLPGRRSETNYLHYYGWSIIAGNTLIKDKDSIDSLIKGWVHKLQQTCPRDQVLILSRDQDFIDTANLFADSGLDIKLVNPFSIQEIVGTEPNEVTQFLPAQVQFFVDFGKAIIEDRRNAIFDTMEKSLFKHLIHVIGQMEVQTYNSYDSFYSSTVKKIYSQTKRFRRSQIRAWCRSAMSALAELNAAKFSSHGNGVILKVNQDHPIFEIIFDDIT